MRAPDLGAVGAMQMQGWATPGHSHTQRPGKSCVDLCRVPLSGGYMAVPKPISHESPLTETQGRDSRRRQSACLVRGGEKPSLGDWPDSIECTDGEDLSRQLPPACNFVSFSVILEDGVSLYVCT
ncbi:hypothetical protein PGT21_007326 [Puccinia graminis f. sp. tritici]|uniref:Uncharacterized protein n=1 Tax=Puccinia graminis f. sp. tritici TaxID=56615 RepID=A0A5B0RII2_PUCGR|nr:hypothetical protein PGT21_007326 [Puccinia graminis f. sp. tritici]KAA1124948.1 hypothetical protein PGTUg99_037076 [Puccinia graminis f. sp. tritici]